ncbi:MAG: CAAX geranylgeranyltransferase alpha subunit [Cyphobasidiales sp. Tagirdzhanova-0007]|nr:MAG: CAAX geranylgeranyltransferase alpha subunit [Cyphobasidiales sp. Tagirdzhanova-0007]
MSMFVPWEARDGWTDVTPIAQAEAPNPLVPINYAPEYISAMATFRWILAQYELSKRVLDLTFEIVKMNPAHYTVWAYRSKTLLYLKDSLEDGVQLLIKELGILDELVRMHLKNYQVWQHRRIIVTSLSDPSREIPFTTRALAFDAKNYHTWAYRQWALSHFYSDPAEHGVVWKEELKFTDNLLDNDVRNNSAWNHRWFVVFARLEKASESVQNEEVRFAKIRIDLAPNNPSAWNYLRGILDHFSLSYLPHLQWAQRLRSPADCEAEVVLAMEFLADIFSVSNEIAKVEEIYNALAKQADPMRKGYWNWKKSQICAAASDY